MKRIVLLIMITVIALSLISCNEPKRMLDDGIYVCDIYRNYDEKHIKQSEVCLIIAYGRVADLNDFLLLNNIDDKEEFFDALNKTDAKSLLNKNSYLYSYSYNGFDMYIMLGKDDSFYLFYTRKEETGDLTISGIFKIERYEDVETTLPVEMPDDFSFSVRFDFDAYYDSLTHELKNGYNNELNVECKTELVIKEEDLREIYRLLRSVKFDRIPDAFSAAYPFKMPDYTPYVEIRYGDYVKNVQMYGGSEKNWLVFCNYGEVYQKIVNDYIKSSEEYKSLPPNTNLYD